MSGNKSNKLHVPAVSADFADCDTFPTSIPVPMRTIHLEIQDSPDSEAKGSFEDFFSALQGGSMEEGDYFLDDYLEGLSEIVGVYDGSDVP